MKGDHLVTTYEPIQVAPCIGSGLRATFSDPSGTQVFPVAAMAVCRVRSVWYSARGRKLSTQSIERTVCGILTYREEGFEICEEHANFLGYLQPGEELDEVAAGTTTVVSIDGEPRK